MNFTNQFVKKRMRRDRVMVTKLVELSKKNRFLHFFIGISCRTVFMMVSLWNEAMGFLRTIGIGGNTYKSLKNYKDKYKNERCFIIATGPSLTLNDLEALKNEYTFGMNAIIKKFHEMDFRPTYYGIQDHLVFKALESEIMEWYRDNDNIFVADRIKWHSRIGKNWNVFPLNMSYHAYKRWFKNQFFVKSSDDLYRRVYSGFSITYTLIELAIYMGFSEIYLIGADCSFCKDYDKHFVEHGVHDTMLETAAARNIAGYIAAKRHAENHNIKIMNATRGGYLEVFPRIDFDSIKLK